MAKSQAEIIKENLEYYAQINDVSGVKNYINEHKNDILKIYYQYGGGSEYLRSAYDHVCLSYPKFAMEYQGALETLIAGDILFLDE